eukprot:7016042-Ditylum_brightwellii.AAC.1
MCVQLQGESQRDGGADGVTFNSGSKEEARCIVGFIVADDDSSMRAILCHSYEHLSAMMPGFVWPHAVPKENGKLGPKLGDTGRLPMDVPQPRWLADPMHRMKVVELQFFNLMKKGKRASNILMADCLPQKKY